MTQPSLDQPRVVMAAAATGVAAVLVFALLPVISGAMADLYALPDEDVGLVALSYFGVYALVALSSSLWVRRLDWRIARRAGFSLMLAGLLICAFAGTFTAARWGLAVTALGAGLLFPVSLTVVSDMTHADRGYAIKLSAEQLAPALLLFMLSSSLLAGYNSFQLMLALMMLVFLAYLFSYGLPALGNSDIQTSRTRGSHLGLALLARLALSINFAGFAGIWAFLERIGSQRDFEPGFINTWLGVGLITSGVGPLGAAWLEDRFGRMLPLISATLITLASLTLLTEIIDKQAFAIALFLMPLAYYFSIAYLFGVVADADHNGKMAGQMSFALAVGAALGPALFGLLLADDGPVVVAMGALIGTGALLMSLIQWRLQGQKSEESVHG